MSGEAAGLYLHVPFCASICPYCDFAVVRGGADRHRGYVEALLRELEGWRDRFPPADTLYLGGGTPSLLAPDLLHRVLEAIEATLSPLPETLRTLEVNPEDADFERLGALRDLGFAAVSLGVQSFSPQALSFLGRRHDPEQAARAVTAARAAGFSPVSLDLIYGLPGQTTGDWRQDLETAVALEPDHLSCYQLTVEPRTPFGKQVARDEWTPLPEDGQADLFLLTHRLLADRGYAAYEVSNFARSPAHRSRHNRKYWRHLPYLGLGPSAHSYLGDRRWWNHRHVDRWRRGVLVEGSAIEGQERLGPAELALETLALGLRTTDGVALTRWRERFGSELLATNASLVARLQEEGLVELAEDRLVPTLRGLAVADSLPALFELPA